MVLMMRKKQRCIHGAVTHPKHLYIPLTAQGVLLCGGYITSRTAEEAKRQQHRAAHAHKHTRKTERRKKKSIQKNLTGRRGRGGGRESCERSSAGGRGEKKKGSLSCLGPETELSATMTNQLCALAGSKSVWRPRAWRASER